VLLFVFIGKMIDLVVLFFYGGMYLIYMEFVIIGVVMSLVIGLLLECVVMVVCME